MGSWAVVARGHRRQRPGFRPVRRTALLWTAKSWLPPHTSREREAPRGARRSSACFALTYLVGRWANPGARSSSPCPFENEPLAEGADRAPAAGPAVEPCRAGRKRGDNTRPPPGLAHLATPQPRKASPPSLDHEKAFTARAPAQPRVEAARRPPAGRSSSSALACAIGRVLRQRRRLDGNEHGSALEWVPSAKGARQ